MTTLLADDRTLDEAQPARSLLRMAVGEQVLAVAIEHVREILQVARLTPLPRTPAFVRGVMNLRGAVVPVIDLSARLSGTATDIGRRSCIVVVEYQPASDHADAEEGEGEGDDALAPGAYGLLVDAVFEVFDCAPGEAEPVPALGTQVDAQHLECMARAHGSVVGVLALQSVLSPRELAAAIAAHRPPSLRH